MEIELNDDQAKKVGILKENGIEVGDAIDMLFDLKHSFADTTERPNLKRNLLKLMKKSQCLPK